jgi:hypothetical protein
MIDPPGFPGLHWRKDDEHDEPMNDARAPNCALDGNPSAWLGAAASAGTLPGVTLGARRRGSARSPGRLRVRRDWPDGHRALGLTMHDIPLTLRDLVGAVVIGLALGALIGFGI